METSVVRERNGVSDGWRLHRGKLLGALAGVVVALLILWLHWGALLVIALSVIGGLAGAWLVDSHNDIDLTEE